MRFIDLLTTNILCMMAYLKKIYGILILVAVCTACVDDGENGIAGKDFTESTQYGSILMTLSGKRPDGVAFQETFTFPYSSVISSDGSSVTHNNGSDQFYIIRYETSPASLDKTTYVMLRSQQNSAGGTLVTSSLQFNVVLTTSDYKYFRIEQQNAMDYLSQNTATDFSYDKASGALKYKIAGKIPASHNDTGYDLNIQVAVDAKVFESID